MPPVHKLLDRLEGAVVYSSFDFAGAFCRIPPHRSDRLMPALHTRSHKLEKKTYAFWAPECR